MKYGGGEWGTSNSKECIDESALNQGASQRINKKKRENNKFGKDAKRCFWNFFYFFFFFFFTFWVFFFFFFCPNPKIKKKKKIKIFFFFLVFVFFFLLFFNAMDVVAFSRHLLPHSFPPCFSGLVLPQFFFLCDLWPKPTIEIVLQIGIPTDNPRPAPKKPGKNKKQKAVYFLGQRQRCSGFTPFFCGNRWTWVPVLTSIQQVQSRMEACIVQPDFWNSQHCLFDDPHLSYDRFVRMTRKLWTQWHTSQTLKDLCYVHMLGDPEIQHLDKEEEEEEEESISFEALLAQTKQELKKKRKKKKKINSLSS